MRQLGRETISASVFDLDDLDALKVERDENDQRKEPTISDKVALADAIAKRLAGPGRPRNGEDISTFSKTRGRSATSPPRKPWPGSGKTLEVAPKVVEHDIRELVEAMDHTPTRQDAAGAAHEGRVMHEPCRPGVRRRAHPPPWDWRSTAAMERLGDGRGRRRGVCIAP